MSRCALYLHKTSRRWNCILPGFLAPYTPRNSITNALPLVQMFASDSVIEHRRRVPPVLRPRGSKSSSLIVITTSSVVHGCRLSATELFRSPLPLPTSTPCLERTTMPRHDCAVPTEFSGSRLKTRLFNCSFPDFLQCL